MDFNFIIINLSLFLAGLALLLIGGEALVRGSSNFARSLGISPIVIGLTVVAFGTSSPEFLVCLTAAIKGSSDIALGNIVGSNISNIGLILGMTALIYPILINKKIFSLELPIMVVLTIALFVMSYRLEIGRIEGIIIFLMLPVFIILSYKKSKKIIIGDEISDFNPNTINQKLKYLAYIIFGLGGLIFGANLIVEKSIVFARSMGVSELVIGITAVAIGTSLPELSASIIAAVKREHDLIIGNIVGSNIFNIGILGLVSTIQPISINSTMFKLEFPALILFTLILIPIMRTGFKISRIEGLIFFILYVGFVFLLF